MELSLEGKIAVVTAAGGAICGEVARELAREGAEVAVWDIDPEAARRTVETITAAGGTAAAFQCDGTNGESVARAAKLTATALGVPSVLVNGTGGSRPETTTSHERSFFGLDPEDMLRVMKLNYLSAVMTSQALGAMMIADGGSIVTISSVAGVRPLSRAITYSDSKAALISFTRWLAVELAAHHGGKIRVNTVAPGFVLTNQNRFLLEDSETGGATERGRTVLRQVPLGRYGTPEEIAAVVTFLASDRARFVHGAVVPVDGGFTAFSGV